MVRNSQNEHLAKMYRLDEKKEWLKRYSHLLNEIKELQEEHHRIMEMAVSLSPSYGDKVIHSREDGLQKAVDELVEIGERIVKDAADISRARDEIVSAITSMPIGKERDVLWQRYILGKTFEQISESLSFDQRYILRIHQKALIAIDIALPERAEGIDA